MLERTYLGIYMFTSLILVVGFLRSDKLVVKVFFGFFFLYYFIPFAPISSYRGEISTHSLSWFSLFIILSFVPLLIPRIRVFGITGRITSYSRININSNFTFFVLLHLFFVYLILAKVYFSHGLIVLNQEARFGIGGLNSYLIKSSIYIPLFFPFIIRKGLLQKLIFVVLPLLPALLIGSRGTVILIIISLVLLFIIKDTGESYRLSNSMIWHKRKGLIFFIGIFTITILNAFYYLRRIFSDVLISNTDLISKYFTTSNMFVLLIIPLYFGFKETVGISNIILENEYRNTGGIPLFFLELFTILPGEQPSPGRYVADLIGASLEGGLTPGLFGGLFLDFGYFAVLGGFFFVWIVRWLISLSKNSDALKIILVLTISQFFHLYHRGFLKWEYFFGYIIVGFYLLLLNRNRIKI